MARNIEYINRATGEVTSEHSEAKAWYRSGDEVEVWYNDKSAILVFNLCHNKHHVEYINRTTGEYGVVSLW